MTDRFALGSIPQATHDLYLEKPRLVMLKCRAWRDRCSRPDMNLALNPFSYLESIVINKEKRGFADTNTTQDASSSRPRR
jgi:hypothetical protein